LPPLFFVRLRCVEGTLTLISISGTIGTALIPDQRLHGRYEGPRDQQKVAVEHADHVEESVESGYNLACLDPGYVHLRQAQMLPEFELAPAAPVPLLDQLTAERLRQAIEAGGLDV
jgi:hypothetical protein